jgi:hypothetical protein
MTAPRLAALAGALVLAAPLPAPAATVTFDPIPTGGYTGHSEDGFVVTSTDGVWNQFLLGNPLYSILSVTPTAGLMLSASGGGEFSFESIDLRVFGGGGGYGAEVRGLAPGSGVYDYLITGFHSGGSVLSIAGSIAGTGEWATIAGDPTAALDSLAIAFTGLTSSGFNVDNIVLGTPVPEPATAIGVGAGLVGLGVRARRLRRAR